MTAKAETAGVHLSAHSWTGWPGAVVGVDWQVLLEMDEVIDACVKALGPRRNT